MRSSRSRASVNRRLGIHPGRRFAFTVVLVLVLVLAAAAAANASADQTVVSATIYPSAQGTVSHQSVGVATLDSCPAYSGSNPIYLYPPGQPYQLPATSWTLATMLTCGLQIPLGDVTSVQVLNPSQGFEAPLDNADLNDPTRYQDAQAPDALPAISVDGSENQTAYVRPFRGGSDDNARDAVTENGAPITLVVYVNGPPLTVQASAQTLSSTAMATTAKLSAAVLSTGGSPVPASALAWSWDFGDGATSAAATPEHTFAAGSYDVTVQVTDVSSGAGGTATIQFRTPASPAPGRQTQTGGNTPTKSKSPAGTDHGKHSDRPAGRTGATPSGGSDKGRSTSPSGAQTPTPAATSTTSTTSTTNSTTTPAPATTTSPAPSPATHTVAHRPVAHPRPRRPPPRRRPPPAPAGSLVTGRLISDVTPRPVGSSPLVHVTPTAAAAPPAVRQATRSSSLSALVASLVVVGLLGLGAWRELRGRHWRTAPRGR